MYANYPKGRSAVPSPGKCGHKCVSEDTGAPQMYRTTITDTPEKRQRQIYGNQYGKKTPPDRPEAKGMMTSPRKTMISIG